LTESQRRYVAQGQPFIWLVVAVTAMVVDRSGLTVVEASAEEAHLIEASSLDHCKRNYVLATDSTGTCKFCSVTVICEIN